MLARNDVNASHTSESVRKRRESTNLDVDRNTDDPAGALNASKMTLAEREGGEVGARGYKGLESRLVDENDKKFIRRSVGRRAAASLAS